MSFQIYIYLVISRCLESDAPALSQVPNNGKSSPLPALLDRIRIILYFVMLYPELKIYLNCFYVM